MHSELEKTKADLLALHDVHLAQIALIHAENEKKLQLQASDNIEMFGFELDSRRYTKRILLRQDEPAAIRERKSMSAHFGGANEASM